MAGEKGFVIVLVVAFLIVLVLMAGVIVSMGGGEILQTRLTNDTASAYYVAVSGAEIMYANLKSKEGQTVSWPQSIASGEVRTRSSGGQLIGTFSVTANTSAHDIFGIVSEGTVNGHKARVVARYGFDSSFTNGYPLGNLGPMTLAGAGLQGVRSWVRAEGPLASASTIKTNSYVQVSGDVLQNQSFTAPTFWLGTTFDTNNDHSYIADTNGDGAVNSTDILEGQETVFAADDVNSDTVIDDKDAFTYYYTIYLNNPANNSLGTGLGIGPGEANYYSGSQSFNPWSVPGGTPIIFVDGNVDISFYDTKWWGGSSKHTIVSTGDINIVQPTNGSDDTLTLVSYGDVNTGGVRAFAGVRGNIVIYAGGDFNAYYGGRTDGTIFAEGNIDVDTVLPIPGLLNRDINKGTVDWSDPANWPLGLPPNYSMVSLSFRIKDEEAEFVPIWQEN